MEKDISLHHLRTRASSLHSCPFHSRRERETVGEREASHEGERHGQVEWRADWNERSSDIYIANLSLSLHPRCMHGVREHAFPSFPLVLQRQQESRTRGPVARRRHLHHRRRRRHSLAHSDSACRGALVRQRMRQHTLTLVASSQIQSYPEPLPPASLLLTDAHANKCLWFRR